MFGENQEQDSVMKRFAIASVLGASLMLGAPGAALAKPSLGQVAPIRDGLIAVAIAYEISEVCPSIKARKVAGVSYLLGLKSKARKLGYSNAEIDAFTDSKAEQDRLERLARAALTKMGGQPGNAESHCAVGRAEMAKGSVIGRLLR